MSSFIYAFIYVCSNVKAVMGKAGVFEILLGSKNGAKVGVCLIWVRILLFESVIELKL